MQLPLEIRFHNTDRSTALEERIRKEAEKLEQYHDRITACRVTVECPHHHHQQGKLYNVKVDVTVPGGELVASHPRHDRHAHEDPYVAVRDAFRAIRRRLEDLVRKQRGKVKHHDVPSHGKVLSLFPNMDYGMIRSADGREIYFHRNSVIGADFDKLGLQTEVRFVEEAGENGPQASTVEVPGKHHPA